MAFNLEKVVPWGRSLEEYAAMFDLEMGDADAAILGCGDGPASFNKEMQELGRRVISTDPVYRFTSRQIRDRIHATYTQILAQLRENRDDFIWERFRTPEALCQNRLTAMEAFLAHYGDGVGQGRYVACGLPSLPFVEGAFDLALCSHFLFVYPDQLSVEFHMSAIHEMARVAKEVRIFPLVTMGGIPYPDLETVLDGLAAAGYQYEQRIVNYEFQRGGNRMLRVWKE